jgi:hypothetical protein
MKSGKVKWAGHAVEVRNALKFWSENLKERGHAGDVGTDDRIILKCVKKW